MLAYVRREYFLLKQSELGHTATGRDANSRHYCISAYVTFNLAECRYGAIVMIDIYYFGLPGGSHPQRKGIQYAKKGVVPLSKPSPGSIGPTHCAQHE